MSTVQAIRTFVFYLLLSLSALFWCTLSMFVAPFLPFRLRYRFINVYWCRFAVWLTGAMLGIRYEVIGAEHVPSQPCVILANHQSTWETFFLSCYFQPLSQVLKRELLYVPFFGWAMAMLRPIAIDRDNPKAALKHIAKKGDELLKDNIWVLIFPEGTRVPVGQMGKFSRGGAALAAHAGLPVLPVAHNAGRFWPKQGWSKTPGCIDVIYGPPLYAKGEDSRSIAELNQRAEAWIAEQMARIDPPASQPATLGEQSLAR